MSDLGYDKEELERERRHIEILESLSVLTKYLKDLREVMLKLGDYVAEVGAQICKAIENK